jgi:hypothetical protein
LPDTFIINNKNAAPAAVQTMNLTESSHVTYTSHYNQLRQRAVSIFGFRYKITQPHSAISESKPSDAWPPILVAPSSHHLHPSFPWSTHGPRTHRDKPAAAIARRLRGQSHSLRPSPETRKSTQARMRTQTQRRRERRIWGEVEHRAAQTPGQSE